jgi:hypothetical protein
VCDGPLCLGDLQTMTRRAQLGLSSFDELTFKRLRAVDAVAGGAREIPALVRAVFPTRVTATVVASQARLVRFSVGDLSELSDMPLVVVVYVRLSRPVTALAAMGRLWRARVLRLGVRRPFERITF